jgi:uncharacterized protein YodC (DUF2158 family)
MAFAPGDIVALKSGGYSMTVASIDEEDVECLWVSDSGEFFRQLIPAIALSVIEQSESDAEDDTETEQEEEEEDEDDEDDEDEDDKPGEKRRAETR